MSHVVVCRYAVLYFGVCMQYPKIANLVIVAFSQGYKPVNTYQLLPAGQGAIDVGIKWVEVVGKWRA
jgi:hypothetical protein